MSSLTEYDLRQILLIRSKIDLFKEKVNKPEENMLVFFELVSDLGGLLNALENVAEIWKSDAQNEVNALEIIYDSIQDGSIIKWKGNYKEDIHNAVSKLKMMTNTIIEEYLNKSDLNISENAIHGGANWLICPKCNDAWESDSIKAMVICPNCHHAFHNPCYTPND